MYLTRDWEHHMENGKVQGAFHQMNNLMISLEQSPYEGQNT